MSQYYLISGFVLVALFLFFQIISKTLNSIIDYLLRVEFLLQAEYNYRKEELDVQRVLDLEDY